MLFKELGEIKQHSALLKSEAIFIGSSKARKYFAIPNFLVRHLRQEIFYNQRHQ